MGPVVFFAIGMAGGIYDFGLPWGLGAGVLGYLMLKFIFSLIGSIWPRILALTPNASA